MKVLMLGWELPPHNSGGLGIACYHLCKALSKRNIDIEFILPYSADHGIDFMSVSSISPQTAVVLQRSGIAYDSFKYIDEDGNEHWLNIHEQQELYEHAVAEIVHKKEFDIIHAHDWLTFRAALRAKHIKNVPLILHVHSIESDRSGNEYGNPMVREIEAIGLQMADRIIAVSQHTKRAIMRDYGIPAEKIEVVHNSIDAGSMETIASDNAYKYLTLMKSLGYRVVVNVGRLTIQKGLPNLLKAAQLVIQKAPKTLFLIVGSGEQYYELITLAADLGIGDKVLFTDFQRGKNWRDAFMVGDLFVMPSVSEPFGLTPLESIGFGTPALVSKQSGVSEVLQNCLKVDYWDVNEMANLITSVMLSDPLRDELWTNAYSEYVKLTWDRAGDKIQKVYESHIQGNYS
jgi:glycosyltransferase involved in cell wall biosynthesis